MSGPATIAIVGAGAFGTALAIVAARRGRVILWGRDVSHLAALRDRRENRRHLPGIRLPDRIAPTGDLSLVAEAEIVLIAVPSQATREIAEHLAPHLRTSAIVVACAKGIERETGLRQSEVLRESVPGCAPAALSGPGFADEIARGLPTAVTVAAGDLDLAYKIAAALSAESFRPYASDDLVGVEIGGAAKNVLAIACGIVAGRGLGESARAALISRGLIEMTRLGVALGARPETFMGLSGLGDLVLTATGARSRNTAYGIALGSGRNPAELGDAAPLAEGVFTARIAARLAAELGIETPIMAAVADIVDGALPVDAAIERLIRRPLKAEHV